jgi:hypothetical protein
MKMLFTYEMIGRGRMTLFVLDLHRHALRHQMHGYAAPRLHPLLSISVQYLLNLSDCLHSIASQTSFLLLKPPTYHTT